MNFIEVNGVGLRYELSGSGERTVVLIHEMGGRLESWDQVAPRARRRAGACCATTRAAPGCRRRSAGALSIDTMVDDLPRCSTRSASRARSRSPASPSAARSRCMRRCAFPQRISAAVVGSPATGIAARPSRGRAGARRAHRARGHAHRRRRTRGQRLSGGAARRRGALRRPSARAGSATIRRASPPSTACSPAWTWRRSLPRIACPVLVIGGEFDRGRPPAWSSRSPRRIPGAQFKVLRDRALCRLQTPELMARRSARFWTRLEPAGAGGNAAVSIEVRERLAVPRERELRARHGERPRRCAASLQRFAAAWLRRRDYTVAASPKSRSPARRARRRCRGPWRRRSPCTCRAPHSPRSCRTASISRNRPYMPGWQ